MAKISELSNDCCIRVCSLYVRHVCLYQVDEHRLLTVTSISKLIKKNFNKFANISNLVSNNFPINLHLGSPVAGIINI